MRRVLGTGLALVLLSVLTSCATGSDLRFPLTLGQGRGAAEASLESKKLCRHEPKELQRQSYVRCHSKGFKIGESWLVVDYNAQQKAIRVRRLEHYPSQDGATKRWNALAQQRLEELGAESQEARDALAGFGEAPQGAVVWKAWRKSSGDLQGVYLVKPAEEGEPNVIEVLRRASRGR